MSLRDDFDTSTSSEDRLIGEAARLNQREDLTPEERAKAIPKRTTEIEEASKINSYGDRTRRQREARENPLWTAEALALESWSTYNVGYNFKHTAEVYTLMFASFVGSDSELWDRAATMRDWESRYAPEPGSPKTTLADMPYSAASFLEIRTAEARAEFNDTAPDQTTGAPEPADPAPGIDPGMKA